MPTPNKARGEVGVEIDGVKHIMVLTLGAMAKIEAVTGAASLSDVGVKLANPKADHLIGVIASLLEAGGTHDAEALVRTQPMTAMQALTDAMMEAFTAGGVAGKEADRPLESPGLHHGVNGSPSSAATASMAASVSAPMISGA